MSEKLTNNVRPQVSYVVKKKLRTWRNSEEFFQVRRKNDFYVQIRISDSNLQYLLNVEKHIDTFFSNQSGQMLQRTLLHTGAILF